MSEQPDKNRGEPARTDPKSFLVQAVSMLGQLVIPLIIAAYTIFDEIDSSGIMFVAIPLLIAIIGINVFIAYLRWRRFTYWVGEEDIRVESGIISRTARSVPYERIQDVSLEQQLVPRLFGLVEIKFETGSGGGEDLKLSYLTDAEGARLRELVRERREHGAGDAGLANDGPVEGISGAAFKEASRSANNRDSAASISDAAATLFEMKPRRLFKFGLFEFSLAIVAVLFGITQQFEFLLPFELWDLDAWQEQLAGPGAWLAGLGPIAQLLGAVFAVLSLVFVGLAAGIIRTFLRDWGFLLERTARGFRRRRGLLTRTDVVMPVHRVQAVAIGTRFLRYRFGWHGLKFVSLAQDAGSSSHVVAPFAQMEEIEPIIAAAGFKPPSPDLDWRHASRRARFDNPFYDAVFFILIAIPVAIFAPFGFVAIPLALALVAASVNLYGWQFHRHALSAEQVFSTRGFLSPSTQATLREKLHSVEIAQGPLAQRRGYATLHLGLAGGHFSIPDVPVKRARELRKAILKSIEAKDFSELY